MHTTVRGHSLRYELEGHGPRVLLIMGFGMSGEAWRPLVQRTSDAFTVCRYDARGLGESTAGDGPHDLVGLADDAVALLDHLGWEDAHVVGVSMGGMIAQHLATRHRARVRSMGLLATHPGPGWRCLPSRHAVSCFLEANRTTGAARAHALHKLLFKDPSRPPVELDAETFQRVATPASGHVRLRHLASILVDDRRRALAHIEGLPTLVLRPNHDILVPPRCSDELVQRIPGARLHALTEGGHGALIECADEIAQALRAHWLNAEPRPTSAS